MNQWIEFFYHFKDVIVPEVKSCDAQMLKQKP